jgi:hypothetical protein
MNLELNEVQAEVLTRELHSIIQNDRYPLSPRIVSARLGWEPTLHEHVQE